mgnify:CR=1 FL=1
MDGGYYAIKGFEFQIDKTLEEVLNASENNLAIRLEQIQDIDSDDFVMQVKYKEATKLILRALNLKSNFANFRSSSVSISTESYLLRK